MKQYRAATNIHATPDAIWKILSDAGGYPRWDQSMDHIEGKRKPSDHSVLRTAAN
jgi:hypothetical protein